MGRPLTPRQEAFVRGVVAGKTKKQAYIDAGYRWTGTWKRICRLGRTPHVAARLDALRREAAGREAHLQALAHLRDAALAEGRISAAIQAEALRGRALGYYSHPATRPGAAGTRPAAPVADVPSADPFDAMTDEEIDAAIRELAKDPSVRAVLEHESGAEPAGPAAPVPPLSEAAGVPRGRGDAP